MNFDEAISFLNGEAQWEALDFSASNDSVYSNIAA